MACAAGRGKAGWDDIWDMPASTAPQAAAQPALEDSQAGRQALDDLEQLAAELRSRREAGGDGGEDEAAAGQGDGGADARDGLFRGGPQGTARFFKLVPLAAGEATLEIDGVKMHITATKLPTQDARDKVGQGDGGGAPCTQTCTALCHWPPPMQGCGRHASTYMRLGTSTTTTTTTADST